MFTGLIDCGGRIGLVSLIAVCVGNGSVASGQGRPISPDVVAEVTPMAAKAAKYWADSVISGASARVLSVVVGHPEASLSSSVRSAIALALPGSPVHFGVTLSGSRCFESAIEIPGCPEVNRGLVARIQVRQLERSQVLVTTRLEWMESRPDRVWRRQILGLVFHRTPGGTWEPDPRGIGVAVH